MSRYRWQLAMTHVVNDGITVREKSRRDSVEVVLDWQQNAEVTWTWHYMLEELGWNIIDDRKGLWNCWMQRVKKLSG